MSMRRDVLVSYAGTAIQMLAPMLALPWYWQALGGQAYGLLSFVVLIQTIAAVLETGLGQALVREFSVRVDGTAAGQHRAMTLLAGLQRVYWLAALALGGLTAALAPWLAQSWIKLDNPASNAGVIAILSAAAIVTVQLPGALYRSALIGSQRQVAFQCSLMAWTLVRQGFGVALVLAWPDLMVYLVWQMLSSLAETWTRRRLAYAALGSGVRAAAGGAGDGDWRSVLRGALGMGGAVLLGALTVQIDRVLLSRLVSLEEFGHYTIAATLAVGALQAVYPLTMATLPRAVQLRHDPRALRRLSWRLLAMNGCVVVVGGLLFLGWGETVLGWWLRDAAAVAVILPILSVSLWGTALNALYNVGYVNWLAHGRSRSILFVNALSLGIALLAIPPLVARWGLVGAASGWVAMNLIGFVLSLGWLKKLDTR